MVMRNPLYLDEELLQNAADYFGLQLSDKQYVEKDNASRGGSAGVKLLDVGVKGQVNSGSETTVTYESRSTPLRLLNDAIDAALRNGDVKEVADSISKGDFVEVDGEPALTIVSEIGAVLSKLLPAVGAAGGKLDAAALVPSLMTDAVSVPQLFELENDQSDLRIFFSVEPGFFYRSNTPETLAGELTVFASVERLVAAGSELPTLPWLLPGMTRITRRAIENKGVDELIKQFGPMLGDKAGEEYRIEGPALLIRPLAIY